MTLPSSAPRAPYWGVTMGGMGNINTPPPFGGNQPPYPHAHAYPWLGGMYPPTSLLATLAPIVSTSIGFGMVFAGHSNSCANRHQPPPMVPNHSPIRPESTQPLAPPHLSSLLLVGALPCLSGGGLPVKNKLMNVCQIPLDVTPYRATGYDYFGNLSSLSSWLVDIIL